MTNHNNQPPKDETPTSDQASGVSGEQLSFLPKPIFCPVLPPLHSAAAVALKDLLTGDITQIDWLKAGKGWRLSAAVKELDYLGWDPKSMLVKCGEWKNPIARYSLKAEAKQFANAMHSDVVQHG